MENFIARNTTAQTRYDELRDVVVATRESISDNALQELIDRMPERCQAVIDANGMHIPF
jgi:hypothetical protein